MNARSPALSARSATTAGALAATVLLPVAPRMVPLRRTPSAGSVGRQAAQLPSQRRAVQANVIVKSRTHRVDQDIDKVLFSEEQLNEILDDLGRQIGSDYHDKDLLILGVLKGGFVFTADLVRHLSPVPNSVEVDFIKAASYGLGINSSGQVHIDESFDMSIVKDKHVLVAEDIIDTGLTMSAIVKRLREAGAMSVRVVVLLDKRARRKVVYDADYVGILCPDEFVVGYGIDFAERYRWLPYIGVPKPEVVAAMKAQRLQHEQEERARLEAALLLKQEQQQQRKEQQEQQELRQLANGHAHANGHTHHHATSVSSNGSAKGAGSSGPVSSVGNGAVTANGLLFKVAQAANGVVASNNSNSSNANSSGNGSGSGNSTKLLAKPVAKRS